MDGLQARIDSFKKSKKVKSGQKSKTLKWPHPATFKATPRTLADAGFYYNPSLDDPDNATCYFCSKELGSWEEEDDPMTIHWEKCRETCCWASVCCGSMYDVDGSGRFKSTDKSRIPTSKYMEKARYETFQVGNGWVHDKEKNHGANSKAMARAGFSYTPEISGDDMVTCFYCNMSLSGWDPEDDPLEQHRTRAEQKGCPFFNYASDAKKPSKPSSKAQSKPNSRSTSRNAHQDTLMPTKEHDGESDSESDSPNAAATKSTAKTPRKGRSTSSSSARKSTAKTPKNKRSTSRSTLKDVAELEEDEEEEDVEKTPAPAKKKSRSKSVARSEATEEEVLEAPPTVKKKSRSKSVARAEATDQTGEDDEPEPRKPSRSRAKSKAPADSQDEALSKPSRSRSKASVAPPPADDAARKSSRSKAKPKVQESEQEDEAPVAPPKKKPSHQRTASKSKPKPKPTPVASDEDEASEEVEVPQPIPKKKPAKQKPEKPVVVDDIFDDDDPMDTHVPPSPPQPPSKPLPSATELPPLFIPKRAKSKPAVEEDTAVLSTSRDKPAKPKSKTKQRTPAPQDSRSEREQSTSDELMPLSPVINQQNLAPISKDKSLGKSTSFTSSTYSNASKNSKLKVVEISSDEDVEETPVRRRTPAPGLQLGKENRSRATTEEPWSAAPPVELKVAPTTLPPKEIKQPSPFDMVVEPSTPPRPPKVHVDIDVDMQDVQQQETDINGPSTPPKPTVQLPSSPKGKNTSHPMTTDVPKSVEPPIFPALSKLPFAPLTTLSEAELDMTVEEWIRYQMEVEFDKFRRDGERELQHFRKKAEEVRKVIEGL